MKRIAGNIENSRSEEKNTRSITLEGDLNLNNVIAFRERIFRALPGCDSLKLTMHNTKSIDLSCIQLLQSLRKECTESGKRLVIEIALSQEEESLLVRTGFGPFLESFKSTNQTVR